MRLIGLAVILTLSLMLAPLAAGAQERMISKPDADMIFALTRAEWERYARQVAPPEGWTLRLQPHDTGTVLARFNRSSGIGASVQPLFTDDQGPPRMLVVGSYYPRGVLRITDELIKEIEQAARLDLGSAYSVSANHAKFPETNIEGIELIVMRATKASDERRGSAAGAWVLWTETIDFIEPTTSRGALAGEGFRGEKSWERQETVYETRNACERELLPRMQSRVEVYRAMGFIAVRDDQDGPDKFIRSGPPGSRWCGDHGCVIAGSSGRANVDGRERLSHHNFFCLPNTVDPREPKR